VPGRAGTSMTRLSVASPPEAIERESGRLGDMAAGGIAPITS